MKKGFKVLGHVIVNSGGVRQFPTFVLPYSFVGRDPKAAAHYAYDIVMTSAHNNIKAVYVQIIDLGTDRYYDFVRKNGEGMYRVPLSYTLREYDNSLLSFRDNDA